jgi:hypothetical protein
VIAPADPVAEALERARSAWLSDLISQKELL